MHSPTVFHFLWITPLNLDKQFGISIMKSQGVEYLLLRQLCLKDVVVMRTVNNVSFLSEYLNSHFRYHCTPLLPFSLIDKLLIANVKHTERAFIKVMLRTHYREYVLFSVFTIGNSYELHVITWKTFLTNIRQNLILTCPLNISSIKRVDVL